MSQQFYIKQGSTVLVDLNADPYRTKDGFYPYTPGTADASAVERLDVIIKSTTVVEKVRDIERAFLLARENTSGANGVYLHFALNGTETAWRARILDGQVLHDSRLYPRYKDDKAVITLVIEREPFWEGAEASLPLSNHNSTDVTTGVSLANCCDVTGSGPTYRDNYVEIDGGDVDGTEPAPARIEIQNTYNSATGLRDVWVGHNFRSSMTFQHVLEGEDASYGGTPTSGSTFSGGAYQTFTWSGDAQAEIARWALDTTFLDAAKGQWFRVLARFASTVGLSGTRLQLKTRWPTGTPLVDVGLGSDMQLAAGKAIQEIGTIQLPPWLKGQTGLYPIDLCLYAKKAGGGSLAIDDLVLLPQDGYRFLDAIGTTDYLESLVDDGINQETYLSGWSTPGKIGIITGLGTLMLRPGVDQRLVFMHITEVGSAAIDRTVSVKVYYRPRRRTI